MGELLIFLSELVEGRTWQGRHCIFPCPWLWESCPLAGKEMVRSACSWDPAALAVCLWAGCCFAAVQGAPPLCPWCTAGPGVVRGSLASSWQRPGGGRSAAGRLLLGVVHCRREQGRRSQAGDEGERFTVDGCTDLSLVGGFVPLFSCLLSWCVCDLLSSSTALV